MNLTNEKSSQQRMKIGETGTTTGRVITITIEEVAVEDTAVEQEPAEP